jgi:hypothetical protein
MTVPVRNKRRLLILTLVLVAVSVAGTLLAPFVLYREVALISENTGSRKGYREWFFGLRTRHWYKQAAVEEFVRARHPIGFEQHWISYAGTGYNLYGRKVLFGHFRPGPILTVPVDVLNEWFMAQPEAAKLRFSDLLASGDRSAISTQLRAIWDWELNK